MIQSFPLTLEGIPFRNHGIVGLYPLADKVAVVHFAFGYSTQEAYDQTKRTPNYVLLDTFSLDFSERKQAHLYYYEQGSFTTSDALCYEEDNKFLLNTKRYKGFIPSVAKLIEISDTSLTEIGTPPPPIPNRYNEYQVYTFGEQEVYMASKFRMECRDRTTKAVLWQLKLTAYLYTQVEEKHGMFYFGTAGKGGRFYGVNAADGNIIFSYITGGTVNFTGYKEYFLLANRKEKPILLDPKTGAEVQKIEFGKFTLTYDQYMLVIKDKLYAIASGKDAMYAVCADLTLQETEAT